MTTTRTCPACSVTLEPLVHEATELDRCPAGCGVWLDRGELRAVVASELADRSEAQEQAALAEGLRDAGRALLEAAGAQGRRACPACGAAMELVEYGSSGIPVDECPAHGTWLDAGELEHIEAYAEGFRRRARPGASPVVGVTGIEVPAQLLATIRSVAVPPPA